MLENLLAEFIGVFVTIFVLEELMRRVERRNRKLFYDREQEKKREKEELVLEELKYTFEESMEDMAREWTELLAPEDKSDKHYFYSEKLEEALRFNGSPLKDKKKRATTEYISALGKKFHREGKLLCKLHHVFPDPNDLAKEFVVMRTHLATLQSNTEALDNSHRRYLDAQEGAKEAEGKKLYFLKGGVESNAWNVFATTKKISDKIIARLNAPVDILSEQEMGPPTWGELFVGLFRKRVK